MYSSTVRNTVFPLLVSRYTIIEIEAPETVPDGVNVGYFGS